MENWNNVEGAINSATNSLGSAEKSNAAYLDSIEGRTKTLVSTTQSFWKNLIDSDLIKNSISLMTTLVSVFDKLINNSFSQGLIVTGLLTGAIVFLNSKLSLLAGTAIAVKVVSMFKLMTTNAIGFSMGIAMINKAILASPLFVPALIIGGITAGIALINKYGDTLKNLNKRIDETSSKLTELQGEYEALKGREDLTEEQKVYLQLLEKEIKRKEESLAVDKAMALQREFLNKETVNGGGYSVELSSGSEKIQRSIESLEEYRGKLKDIDVETEKGLKQWKDISEKIRETEDELDKQLRTIMSGIDALEGSDIDFLSPEDIETLKATTEAIKETLGIVDELADGVDALNEGVDALDEYGKKTSHTKDELEELVKTFETVTTKLKDYSVFLDEVNSKEGLSANSKENIISKYHELLPYIDNEKEMRKQLIQIIEQEEDAQAKAYINMMMYSKEFFEQKIKGNADLVNKLNEYYGVDLKNAKDLAQAKWMVENELISKLSQKWGEYFRATSDGIRVDAELITKTMGYSHKVFTEMMTEVQKANEKAAKFDSIVYKGTGVDFSGINTSGIKTGSKGSSSTSKEKEEYKAVADRYARINLELDKNNILLQKNKTLQDLAGDDLAKKIELMKEQVVLEEEHQGLLHDKANLYRKELVELEKTLSGEGFKFKGSGDNRIIDNLDNVKGKTKEVEEQFKRYVDIQSKEIPGLQQLWWNLEKSITDVGLSMEDSVRKAVKEMIELEKENAYMELEVRLKLAKGELEKLKAELESAVSDIEFNIKGLQLEIDEIQESERVRSENIERAKRLEEISKLQSKYYHLQYTNLANMTEEQAKLVGLEKEREQYLERQTKLQELQLKLTNLQNEKNIQQLKKQVDGTWEFEYVADQKAIDDVNKQVEDLQKEHDKTIKDLKKQTLDSLKESQKSYDEWEYQNRIQATIREKQDRIKRYQDEIRDMQEQFAKKEKEVNEQFEKEKEALDAHYRDIDALTEKALEELHETFSDGYGAIYEEISGYMDGLMKDHMALVAALKTQIVIPAPIYAEGSGGWNSGGGGSGKGGSIGSTIGSIIGGTIGGGKGSIIGGAIGGLFGNIKKYHEGGVVGDSDEDLPEMVNQLFNLKPNEQIIKALKGELMIPEENISKNFIPNMQELLNSVTLPMVNVPMPKIPKVALAGTSGSGDTIYYIDELNVPTNDFQSFIKDFTSVVENHPNKTIMKVKKIGGLK